MEENHEETLVLNYLDEEYQAPVETEECEVGQKLDESFDENQNPKIDIKDETLKSTPQKSKDLVVRLEKRELTPKKLSSKRNSTASCVSSTPNIKRRKTAQTTVENKINGLKAPLPKHLETKNLVQKKLEFSMLAKNVKNTQNSNEHNDIVDRDIKIEDIDDDDVQETPFNTSLNASRECEDFDVKYETLEQIHTEFKYESLSETEENIRKKKQALAPLSKKKTPLKSPKGLVKGQSTLDSFFKSVNQLINVVDLKPKCKLPTTNIFKCRHCLYVGNSKANLERHCLIHMDPSDILWYKCTECEYKSKYEHQLKSHTLIHKNPEEIEYFQCPHCELKCSRKHNLNNHIRSIHTDRVNSLHCGDCDYSTFSKDRMAAHVKKHSKEVFTCKLCKFVTKRKEYLESHFKMKHTEVERPFPCDTCSYKGKTKRELDRHYDRMHNKEKLRAFQCNHCNFNSIYKKNLEFHLLHMHQNSEGFQKFICGHCKKEFAYKNGLKTHIIRIHLKLTEDDWHKCQECKYKCKDVNTLKRHIKRNHGAPRLNCKECSFATNRQKSMVAHMKTHEVDNDEILKCPECPYRIIQAISFVYHMKVLHGKPITTKDINKYYLKDD